MRVLFCAGAGCAEDAEDAEDAEGKINIARKMSAQHDHRQSCPMIFLLGVRWNVAWSIGATSYALPAANG